MRRRRILSTSLVVVLALAGGACGDGAPEVSAGGQEQGSGGSTDTTSDASSSSEAVSTTSEVPASSAPTSSSSTGAPAVETGGVASATYLPEGYEATSSEESAPGVTSKRYHYPTSEAEPPRMIIVRTVLDVVPDDVPVLLRGAAEEVAVGENTASLFLPPEGMEAEGSARLRWITPDHTMYEVVHRGPIEDPAQELLRIAENLSFEQ